MDGLRVGVVFGGRSVEHDVSIVTAHQVMEVLAASCEVVPIYITREGKWLSAPGLFDLDVYKNRRWEEIGEEAFIPPTAGYGGLLVPGGRLRGPRRVEIDVVVPAIHGTYGEDGTLQGLLDLADIPYTCSGTVASAAGMDKVIMKAAFRAAGLPVVDHVFVDAVRVDADSDGVADEIEKEIGYPAFVKPARLGSSVGIGKASTRDTLMEALDVARRYDRRILVERAMEGCSEVNCAVLGGPGREPQASVCEQPVAWEEFLTFRDKYLRSGKTGTKTASGMAGADRRIPAPISDELTATVRANAIAAFRAVDAAGVARVDSFVNEATGETWVMEINTVPGSFSFYLWEASGKSFTELTEELIAIAQRAHRLKAELLFSFESGMLMAGLGGKPGGG
ncbi:MAG: D-alanine--D-alanine ligase family protein [Actinomycetota bacterium]